MLKKVAETRTRTYWVQPDGRVFTRSKPNLVERELKANGGKYLKVNIANRTKWIHVLVLEAFVGPRPDGHEACHNDGNTHNNDVSNLRWDTPANNQQDRVRHGTSCRKLTSKQAEQIRHLYSTKQKNSKELGVMFGVSSSVCWKIAKEMSYAIQD